MAPNQMTICRDCFKDEAAFRKAIGDAVNVLLENNYNVNIYYDDMGVGVVCIGFDYKEEILAEKYLCWLDLEEAELIDTERRTDNGTNL